MLFLCKNRREAAKKFWGLFSPRSGENFFRANFGKIDCTSKSKKNTVISYGLFPGTTLKPNLISRNLRPPPPPGGGVHSTVK